MAHGKRSRRGHPKGKAYGFHGLRPATKTRDGGGGSQSGDSQSSQSQSSQSSQDSQSS